MREFKLSDRVRVRVWDRTAGSSYVGRTGVGRTGAVTWVSRTSDGLAYAYYVWLDGTSPSAVNQVIFHPDELEPE